MLLPYPLRFLLSFRVRTFPKESHLGHDTVRALMYYALKVWSDITPLNFHEVAGNNADIQIDFSKADHNDGYPFDGPGGTVAHAFFPGDHHTAGDTHFDDDEYWTFRSSGTFPSPTCSPWLFWDLEGCRRACDYGSSQMGAAFSHFSVIWVASLPHASVFWVLNVLMLNCLVRALQSTGKKQAGEAPALLCRQIEQG